MKSKEILDEWERNLIDATMNDLVALNSVTYQYPLMYKALLAAEQEVQEKENQIQEDKQSFLKTIQNREDEIHTHISRVQELEKEIKEYKKLAKDNVPELAKMLKNRKG